MTKIVDAIFPMYANYKANKRIREKINGEKKSGSLLQRYVDNHGTTSNDVLKQQYDETFDIKDKLEDKAKINIIGITIAIMLIISFSGVINMIPEKLLTPVIRWLIFALFIATVVYLFIAGIIAIKVLTGENVVYMVDQNRFASNKVGLSLEYFKSIEQNRNQNLIRNNSLYSSYECIRNALVCLVVILVLSTMPIDFQQNGTNKSSVHDQYNFTFSSETVSCLITHDVQFVVEEAIRNALLNDNLSGNADVISIIDENNKLFIKFKQSGENITVMLIESYSVK